MNPEAANYFHDWVVSDMRFTPEFMIEFRVIDDDENLHVSKVYFEKVDQTMVSTLKIEKSILNFEEVKKMSMLRWLQNVEAKGQEVEVELLGGNDFFKEHWMSILIECNSVRIVVDDIEMKSENQLSRFIEGLAIFD